MYMVGGRRTQTDGFTLVEMLVTLGVMAVLAALIVPTVGAARSRARQTTCLNNLSQLHKAFVMYAADNEGLMPPYQNESSGGPTFINHTPYTVSPWHSDLLVSALHPYTHSADIWFCPEDPDARTHRGSFGSDHFDTSYAVPFEMGLVGHPATTTGYGVPFVAPPFFETLLKDCDQRGYSHNGSFNRLYFDGHVESSKTGI